MKPWTVRRSEVVLERPWLRVRRQHVVLASGVELAEFDLIESPSWSATFALTQAGDVVLVEQYRHGLGQVSLELPAGVIEPGENPEASARRELLEETGYASDAWEPLSEVATEPSRHTNRAHFFVARGARRVAEPRPDPSEQLRVVLLDAPALREAITQGRVQHGVHVGAMLLALARG